MTKLTAAALALAAAALPLLAPSSAHADTYAEAVLADKPVAYYPLDGDAADASGHGHDAAVAGAVTFDADGPALGGGATNQAARFANGSLELDAAVRDALDGQPAVTVEAWVKLSPDAKAGKNSVVYVPMQKQAAAVELSLKAFPGAKGGPGRAQLLGGARSAAGDKFAGAGAMGDFAEWRHVAMVVDFGRGEVRLYVGGERVGSGKVEFGSPALAAGKSAEPSRVGNSPTDDDGFAGDIDEVAIYAAALDDPDGDGDTADSRLMAHVDAAAAK